MVGRRERRVRGCRNSSRGVGAPFAGASVVGAPFIPSLDQSVPPSVGPLCNRSVALSIYKNGDSCARAISRGAFNLWHGFYVAPSAPL